MRNSNCLLNKRSKGNSSEQHGKKKHDIGWHGMTWGSKCLDLHTSPKNQYHPPNHHWCHDKLKYSTSGTHFDLSESFFAVLAGDIWGIRKRRSRLATYKYCHCGNIIIIIIIIVTCSETDEYDPPTTPKTGPVLLYLYFGFSPASDHFEIPASESVLNEMKAKIHKPKLKRFTFLFPKMFMHCSKVEISTLLIVPVQQ